MPDKKITRRTFLEWIIFLIGSLIGAVLSLSGLAMILSPAWNKKESAWVKIGGLDEFPEGMPVKVDFAQRQADGWMAMEGSGSVWLLKENGGVTAYDPRCTHLGCPYRWDQAANRFACPCHAGVFAKNGTVVSGPPPRSLDRVPVRIEKGTLFVLPGERVAS